MSKLKIRIYSIILKILTKGIQEILFVENMFYRQAFKYIKYWQRYAHIYTIRNLKKKIMNALNMGMQKYLVTVFLIGLNFYTKLELWYC